MLSTNRAYKADDETTENESMDSGLGTIKEEQKVPEVEEGPTGEDGVIENIVDIQLEKRVDADFFAQTKHEASVEGVDMKLTKDQKRALKFAEKRGEDVTKVDLGLISAMEKFKKKKGSKRSKMIPVGFDKVAKKGNSNKFSHFSEMDLQ